MAKTLLSILVTIVLFGAACSSEQDQANPSMTVEASAVVESASQLLGPTEFAQYMDDNPDVPVVNVHIPYEGHIEGTDAFVAFDEVADWDALPEDRSAPLALYCRSGNMSGLAANALEAMGYENVVDLEGGMNAWTDAGFELLTEEPLEAD